jgi:hypothetical protein
MEQSRAGVSSRAANLRSTNHEARSEKGKRFKRVWLLKKGIGIA